MLKSIFNYRNSAILMLLVINFLFSFKYISRYSNWSLFISLGLTFWYFALMKYDFFNRFKEKTISFLILLSLVSAVVLAFFVDFKTDLLSLNVDRWSVIQSFWDAVFKNEYPYYAKSHLNNPPGPMPVYFLIGLPFYLIGDYTLMPVLGLFLLLFLIKRQSNFEYKNLNLLIFVLSSMFFVWEILVRSTVFLNSVLVLMVFSFVVQNIKNSGKKFYWSAILFGLILSTRFVYILPFLVLFVFYLKTHQLSISNFIKWGLIAFLSFVITFLPLIIFYPTEFLIMNPFKVQSGFLIPSYYTLIFIVLAIILSWFWCESSNIFFLSGFSLFISILIYLIYHLFNSGLKGAIIDSAADISYFLFCIPFLLFDIFKHQKI